MESGLENRFNTVIKNKQWNDRKLVNIRFFININLFIFLNQSKSRVAIIGDMNSHHLLKKKKKKTETAGQSLEAGT